MAEGDVPFDPDQIRLGRWTLGRPFTVRTTDGKEESFPANACWREEEDGRLRIGGTLDQEHMRLNPEFDPQMIAETGSLHWIGRYEYAPGTWTIELAVPE
ncbi:hypothetical protein [Gordonia sp. NPDC003376]